MDIKRTAPISKSARANQAAGGRKGATTGGAGAAFQSLLDNLPAGGGDDQVDSAMGVIGGSGIEAVVAINAIDPDEGGEGSKRQPQQGQEEAIVHGKKMINLLRGLQQHLLSGTLMASELSQLASAMETQLAADAPPEVKAVIEEIRLRARVELAKYRRMGYQL